MELEVTQEGEGMSAVHSHIRTKVTREAGTTHIAGDVRGGRSPCHVVEVTALWLYALHTPPPAHTPYVFQYPEKRLTY